MGWPPEHPEQGDYWSVDDAKAVLVQVVHWLQQVYQLTTGVASASRDAWTGKASNAFAETCVQVGSTALQNAQIAEELALVLRNIAADMEQGLFPRARVQQANLEEAEEDLAKAKRRLAGETIDSLDYLIEAKRIRGLEEDIEAAKTQIRLIGNQRTDEANSTARKIAGTDFLRDHFTAGSIVVPDPITPYGAGVAMPMAFPLTASNGDTPAVPPDVENTELGKILREIYSGTTNPKATGDGKLATALLNEIETGQNTFSQWHAEDAAGQLIRLRDLLEADRKPNGGVTLSAADRAVALKEADELWQALNKPLPKDHPLYNELANSPAARRNMASIERKVLEAPSMESITGVEFEQTHPKAAPRPKTAPRLGHVMGGVGAAFALYDVFTMLRAAIDPSHVDAQLCEMFPDSSYCWPGGVPPVA